MKARAWVIAVALLLAVAAAAPARARTPLTPVTSIAWLVNASDYVVEGTVKSYRRKPHVPGHFFITLSASRSPIGRARPSAFTAVVAGRPAAVGQRVLLFAERRFLPGSCGTDPRTGYTPRFASAYVTRLVPLTANASLTARDGRRVIGAAAVLALRLRLATQTPLRRAVTHTLRAWRIRLH
ncbi:MAG: hypothetical protein KC503_47030 [Myxococcales bacterium]|nr:hypothetical protein [Myxococcales bacterium]